MLFKKIEHTLLPEEMLSGDGSKRVLKYKLFSSDDPSTLIKELAVLKIPAFTGIVDHKHDKDSEDYFFIDPTGVKHQRCELGESHGIEFRPFRQLVISIKYWN